MSVPVFMLTAPCSQIDDPDGMFPHPSDLLAVKEAKATCEKCPFLAECLEWALDPASRCAYGVFGGKSPGRRKKLIKDRKLGKPVRPDYGPRRPADRRTPNAA
ncbi:WhiB family transcriptional regulator [Streptomyces sp. NPDC127110]|uniref:WhiB family transcriptional regulator n=1 Tax=Streptomyces sp. NPDC127110 TaxID=3345362 RepID=UPI003643A0A5